MNRVVFLDTSYAIALSAPSDQLHATALLVAEQIESGNVSLVTTRAVALEIRQRPVQAEVSPGGG